MPGQRQQERVVVMKDSNGNGFEPNLDPERWDEDDMEFQTPEEQQQEAEELTEFLEDLATPYCSHCGGRTFTIEFGKKVPCPHGVKQLMVHSNKIVCYERQPR
ncbi:MAG: hypothetical protein EBU46_20050 [Nitrosomonadaceae bacterium]|nr:hypothetical protein [Nitrosomonadaceae bacterium]